MDKPVNAENISPSLIAEGVSSRPSMQRIQEGLLVAQWGGCGRVGEARLEQPQDFLGCLGFGFLNGDFGCPGFLFIFNN